MRHFIDMDSESNLIIHPDIYSVAIFKKLYDRDKTEDKRRVYMDVSFIFWMLDYRSYVADITNFDKRKEEVISLISEDGKYKPDKLVMDAYELYKKDEPLSVGFLNDVKSAINTLRDYYRDLNLADVDNNGKLIHDASKVQNSIKGTGDLLESLEKLENKVKKDVDMQDSSRGGKSKGMFED